MKAKAFILHLTKHIFEDYKEEIPKEDLRSSLKAAIKNIPAGKLHDELNKNFDKNLKRLERSLKNLCVSELPSVSNGIDDSLEELTKSELDGRTDVEEHGPKHTHRMLYNLMGNELQTPNKEDMKKLDCKQRYLVYRTCVQKILNRDKVSDKLLSTILEEFDELCEISKNKMADTKKKPKFDWLPMCDLLLQLATGSRPVAFIRLLRILFDAIQNDVNKCLAEVKASRAESLQKILKKYLTACHLGIDNWELQESETKNYRRYMSALLSLYVDLGCVYSSRITKKKLLGKEIAGFVCYLLQQWPESLLEVVLQLQGLEDENYNMLLPLINKSLETKPHGKDHEYYLKYVLFVRTIKDAFGEKEKVQEWNIATKTIAAKTGFIDWLGEKCKEALEHVPVEDKKFKKTKITRFLLEEAEDDLITTLLDSLSKDETKDVKPSDTEIAMETDDALVSDDLFYLDTAGASRVLELTGDRSAKERKTKHKPIVLKTVEEVEKIVDSEVLDDGRSSPQTYTLDPKFVMDKVKDPEDRKFLQSEIVSITSMSSTRAEDLDEDVEDSDATIGKKGVGSEKSGKWTVSSSSTPNSKRKNRKPVKNDESDFSEHEKAEDFVDSMTSISEDEHKVKSVVRKVTPRKSAGKNVKSSDRFEVLPKGDEVKVKSVQKKSASVIDGKGDSSLAAKGKSDNIMNVDLDIELESQDKCYEISSDRLTTDENETLSTIHESSVEIVDIVLEPTDQDMAKHDTEDSYSIQIVDDITKSKVTKERNGEQTSNILSPKEKTKLKSPKAGMKNLSPVSINSSKTDKSIGNTSVSGNSSCFTTSADASVTDRTFGESSLDDTVKYVSEQCSSQETGSDSDILSDSPQRLPRKSSHKGNDSETKKVISKIGSDSDIAGEGQKRSSRKSSSGGKQIKGVDQDEKQKDKEEELNKSVEKQKELSPQSPSPKDRSVKSPRKSLSEKASNTKATNSPIKSAREGHGKVSTDESDGDVFRKSPVKDSKGQSGTKCTTSMQEKFIDKAIKGRKTPKKSNSSFQSQENVSASVSLFPDENVAETVVQNEEEIGSDPRTKSTEDIIQIVAEIKEKIKSPTKRKSLSKSKEKLNESMFTDDSIESSQDEAIVLGENQESPNKKRKQKTVSETDGNAKDPQSSDFATEGCTEEVKSNGNKSLSKGDAEKGVNMQDYRKTPTKHEDSQNVKTVEEIVVIDLSDDESDSQMQNSEPKPEKEQSFDIPEIKLTEGSTDKSLLEGVKSSIIAVMHKSDKTPTKSSPKTIKPQSKEDGIVEPNGLKSPTPSNKSNTKKEVIKSPGVKETKINNSKNSPICKGIFETVSDKVSETGKVLKKKTGKSPNECFVITDSDTDTEKTEMKPRTPKQTKNGLESRTKEKTPRSASKGDITEQKEILGSPKQQMEMSSPKTPKSDSKRSKQKDISSPKSNTKKSLSPENKYVEQSPADTRREKRKAFEYTADFVPSSQKKSKERSNYLDSDIDSEDDRIAVPDIGVHLKSPTSQTVDGKSPVVQTTTEKSPKRGKNESTLQRGHTNSPKSDSATDQDYKLSKRQTRGKVVLEPVVDSTASDTDGPTRPKRSRGTVKPEPETGADRTAPRGRSTRSNTESKKVPGSKSETDTDMSDCEPRRTRKSVGANKSVSAKEHTLTKVDEECTKQLDTTPSKTVKPRKVSASTTKKATRRVEEIRGARKRRLSGELSGQSGADDHSDSSEVSFPKLKAVAATERRVSKRLSVTTPQTQDETNIQDDASKRYSLRKK